MPGQYRSAQNVKVGWFIRHDDACGASYDFGEQVLTLTAREARAAGIGGDR